MHIEKKKFAVIATPKKVDMVVGQLLEKKARDILALSLVGQSALAEATVILTATSIRHGQGLADHVLAYCREHNIEFLRMEGYQSGQWILLDLNDIIVHVFQEDARELFRLDDLWPSAPVLADKRTTA